MIIQGNSEDDRRNVKNRVVFEFPILVTRDTNLALRISTTFYQNSLGKVT